MPAPHEETLRSERGFDGKLLHLRVDHVRLPSGRESVREVIEHPGAVAIVAVTARDEVILIRQWRHAAGAELIELPAGTREHGEPIETTARRELIEETGYQAGETRLLFDYFTSAGISNERMAIFYATDCTPVNHEAAIDEPIEVELVPRADISALITSGAIQDGKSLVGLLWLMNQSTG